MTPSKARVKDPMWLEPCEESHYYAKRWKALGKKSVLDLGCGLGRHAILFSKEGFKVTAVDPSPYAIDHLNHWQKGENLSIMSRVSDIKDLPFPDNAFDCIWAYNVISHTDTRGFVEILNEIRRVLKADGQVFLTLPSKEGNFPRLDENTIFKTEGEGEKDMPHDHVDLEAILEHFQDFEIDKIKHLDGCYYGGQVRDSKHYHISACVQKEKKLLDYSVIIGQGVRGTIDRPLGSFHPRFPDLQYPLNYGYVDGVMAEDGCEQDVYLMGEDQPVDHFEGIVIAVVHRFNDLESKWVVSSDGSDYTDDEILEKINFQEQYFDSVLVR